jgi:hypothetical protein
MSFESASAEQLKSSPLKRLRAFFKQIFIPGEKIFLRRAKLVTPKEVQYTRSTLHGKVDYYTQGTNPMMPTEQPNDMRS